MPNEDMILPDGFEMPADTGAELSTPQESYDDSGEAENTIETDPEITAEQPRFKVRYNHEEKELGYDEAVPLIQKGMNYDKLQEKFNSIQNDPRLNKYEKVQEVSQLLGYQTDDELLDALYNTYYENVAEQQGLTAEQIRMDTELKRRETDLNQKEQERTQQEARNTMYDRFTQEFPNVKPEDIKPETWDLVRSGVDLTAAYTMQRNRELEAQVKTLKQNMKNAKSAPVNGVTTHGNTEVAMISVAP